ncbi:MAG TPA: carbohydrate ABC transporter permease [Acidimicrobiales bacterium]|nr:carbohydrate ABC transporter permease [Acidimicrobiales bacterium]
MTAIAPAHSVALARSAERRRVRAAAPALSGIKGRSKVLRFVSFVLGTIWLVIVLGPIYYMVLTSFRSTTQYLTANAWLPTGSFTLSSYTSMFHGSGIGTLFRDSAELAAGTIALVAVLSLLSAYRIVRRGSRFAAVSFRLILFGIAVPIQAIVIPLFFITSKLHIYDKMYGLVFVTAASLIPVAVLLMVNYVRLIPRELYDAMAVDGANQWSTFRNLVVPMARPVLAVVSIYAGLGAWNNFLLPLILTQSNNDMVLPLGMYRFATNSLYGINVPVVMAFVFFTMAPILVLYIVLRRQFVKGIGGFALR